MADRVVQNSDGSLSSCNVGALWDQWVGCLVNSECFRRSEHSLGPRRALKTCAEEAKAGGVEGCGKFHEQWNNCKLASFKGMVDTPPPLFTGLGNAANSGNKANSAGASDPSIVQ